MGLNVYFLFVSDWFPRAELKGKKPLVELPPILAPQVLIPLKEKATWGKGSTRTD